MSAQKGIKKAPKYAKPLSLKQLGVLMKNTEEMGPAASFYGSYCHRIRNPSITDNTFIIKDACIVKGDNKFSNNNKDQETITIQLSKDSGSMSNSVATFSAGCKNLFGKVAAQNYHKGLNTNAATAHALLIGNAFISCLISPDTHVYDAQTTQDWKGKQGINNIMNSSNHKRRSVDMIFSIQNINVSIHKGKLTIKPKLIANKVRIGGPVQNELTLRSNYYENMKWSDFKMDESDHDSDEDLTKSMEDDMTNIEIKKQMNKISQLNLNTKKNNKKKNKRDSSESEEEIEPEKEKKRKRRKVLESSSEDETSSPKKSSKGGKKSAEEKKKQYKDLSSDSDEEEPPKKKNNKDKDKQKAAKEVDDNFGLMEEEDDDDFSD